MKYTILLLLLTFSQKGHDQWKRPTIVNPLPFWSVDDDCWYQVLQNDSADSTHFAIYRSVKNRKVLIEGNQKTAIEYLLYRMDSLENRLTILEAIAHNNL
jgi:hypothetical protein